MVSKLDRLKWQAESDAETMAQYQEILQDKARMNRAIKEAKQRSKDLDRRAAAMRNVVNTRRSKTK